MTHPTADRARRDAIARFYEANRQCLERAVGRRVSGGTPHLVEDACQIAWTHLVRRPDIALDIRGFYWLTTTAVHAGWELARTRQDIPAGGFQAVCIDELGVIPGPAGDPADIVVERELHRHRVEAFAQLKSSERRDLYLQALGYRYTEIASATGSTYTAVNRRLSEGRSRVRRLARQGTPH